GLADVCAAACQAGRQRDRREDRGITLAGEQAAAPGGEDPHQQLMLDFDALVLGPVYDTFGTPAVLTIGPATHQLIVVDYSKGMEIDEGGAGIQTIRPVADVRRATLVALGVQL